MCGGVYIYDVKVCFVPYVMGDQWVEVKTSRYIEVVSNGSSSTLDQEFSKNLRSTSKFQAPER